MDALPPIPPDIRSRFEKYAGTPRSAHAAPPWIHAAKFDDPDDPAVVAAVFAAHLIAPSTTSSREPWLIRGVLRATDNGLTLSRLAVEHLSDPSIEATGVVLHHVPVARLRNVAASYLAMQDELVVPALEVLEEAGSPEARAAQVARGVPDAQAERRRWAKHVARSAKKQPLRRGRAGYPADHYRRIAHLALDVYDEGRRDVVAQIAVREHIEYQTARDWVRRARDRGFLGQTQRGRSSWTAGPNLNPEQKEEDDGNRNP